MDADSEATRTRTAAADVPQWSVAPRELEQASPAERGRARIVADKAQLVILKALYARTGENPTKEDIGEVVRETGLEAKWVRKWLKRQRGKARERNSSESNSGSVSVDATGSMLLSPKEWAAASTSQSQLPPQLGYVDANTAGFSPRAPVSFAFHPGPSEPPESPNITAGGGPSTHHPTAYYTTSPVPAARPAAYRSPYADEFQEFSGPWSPGTGLDSGDGFSSGAAYGFPAGPSSADVYLPPTFSVDNLVGQSHHAAATFSDPLRPSAWPCEMYPGVFSPQQDHAAPTALKSSQAVPLDYADPLYAITTEELQPNVELPPVPPSPGIPATIAPAELSTPAFVPPAGLTVGAAYLYELFHGSAAAPPAAPASNSTHFLPELSRPLDVSPDLGAPLSALAAPSPTYEGYAGAPYPLSYQMRLSDLMALTKAIRLASAPPAAQHTRTQEMVAETGACESARGERAEAIAVDFHTAQLQYPRTPVSLAPQDDNARCAPTGVSEPALDGSEEQDGEETEDEAEVVTPCEETDFDLSFGLQADAAKKAVDSGGNRLVQVANTTADELRTSTNEDRDG